MTDTVRTREQLSSLLAITENGGITGQDVRDFFASSILSVEKTPHFYEVRNALFRKSNYLSDLKTGDYVRQLDNLHLYLLMSLPAETHENWLDLGEVVVPIDDTGLTLLYTGTSDDGSLERTVWCNNDALLIFDEDQKYIYTNRPEEVTYFYTQSNDNEKLYGIFDFTGCPNLENFNNYYQPIQSINVSGCVNLQQFQCIGTVGVTLNLSNCMGLHYVYCSNNQSLTLNIGGCSISPEDVQYANPSILELDYCTDLNIQNLSDCVGLQSLRLAQCNLTTFDISGLISLNYLLLQSNSLTQEAVDAILVKLVEFGVTGDTVPNYSSWVRPDLWLNYGSNSSPSEIGLAAIVTLQSRGWYIEYN